MTIDELYTNHIQQLSTEEQLRLVALVTERLASKAEASVPVGKRSIMELHGLGAEIWAGIDAQEYVNTLREEWDRRP